MINIVIAAFFWLLMPSYDAHEADAYGNFIYNQEIELKIHSKNKSDYEIEGKFSIRKIVNAEKDQLPPAAVINSNIYSSVSKLKAKHNGNKIGKENIWTKSYSETDEFFSESNTTFIKYPEEIKKGDTVEYEYSKEYDWFHFPAILRIPNMDSVNSYKISVDHPKNIKVDFYLQHCFDSLDYIISNPSETKTVFELAPTTGKQGLIYFEHNYSLGYVTVMTSAEEDSLDYYSPEGYVQWYSRMADLRPKFENFKDTAFLNELKQLANPKEQLNKILNHLHDNFRYIAISKPHHSIVPFKPDFIWGNKYGDCKDQSALVAALADLVGLNVYMTLINTELSDELEYIHPGLFNHVICCYINKGDTIYFDPIDRSSNLYDISESLVEKEVLVLKDKPFIDVIPLMNKKPTYDLELSGDLNDLKNGKAKLTLRGDFYREIFVNIRNINDNNYHSLLSQLLSNVLKNVKLTNITLDSMIIGEVTLLADARLDKMTIRTPKKIYIPSTIFDIKKSPLTDRETDPYPISFEDYSNFNCTLKLTGVPGALAGDDFDINYNDRMKAATATTLSDSVLTVNYRYTRYPKKFNYNNKKQMFQFLDDYCRYHTAMYIISEGS